MTQKLGAPAPTKKLVPRQLHLRKSRLKKGVTLDEIAKNTKISIRFLKAIEAEEFDKLPGGIFATSYLRQYAIAVGFREADLLAQYEARVNPENECTLAAQAKPAR